jgi:ABC-type antimicrobial peptide transport system permease subunit
VAVREALLQALRLLRAHPLRSALTLFGLVWGTAAVIFLSSWGEGVRLMNEVAFQRAGKNLLQAWPGRVSESFSPAVDRRWLWYTALDVEALRERARLPELVAGEVDTYAVAAFRQRALSLEVRGVPALKPRMIVGAAVLLAATGLFSALVPAWRASRIDPALTLRAD